MGRVTRFVVLVALVGAQVVMPGRADAHTNVCTGLNGFETGQPMSYTTSITTGFAILIGYYGGGCIPSGHATIASGTLTGRCGAAIGSGVGEGHAFSLFWVGNQIITVGAMEGEMTVVERVLPNTCATGASSFIGPGTFAFVLA